MSCEGQRYFDRSGNRFREPLPGAEAGLFGLDEAIARRGVCFERLEEPLGDEGDVVDGLVEGRFVGS